MDELYSKLEEITRQFVACIETVSYVEVEQFVEHRGIIIEQILKLKPTDSSMGLRQKAAIARLQQFDTIIINKIIGFRDEASQQLMQLKSATVQRGGYDQEQTYESYFFDKRK
jgi:hypothetical protein